MRCTFKTSPRTQCGLNASVSSPSTAWWRSTAMCTNPQEHKHQVVSSLVGQHSCTPQMCGSICTLSRPRVLHRVGPLPQRGVLSLWEGTLYGRLRSSDLLFSISLKIRHHVANDIRRTRTTTDFGASLLLYLSEEANSYPHRC